MLPPLHLPMHHPGDMLWDPMRRMLPPHASSPCNTGIAFAGTQAHAPRGGSAEAGATIQVGISLHVHDL